MSSGGPMGAQFELYLLYFIAVWISSILTSLQGEAMKKCLIFVVLFCYPDINKHELGKINNRLAIFDSEIQFVKNRLIKLDNSAKCWMGFLENRLDLANKLNARVENLSKCNKNKQCAIAAKYRLYRYLNILKCRLCDWRKSLNQERIEVEYDIRKFNLNCTDVCLHKTECILEEPISCDIECIGDVAYQKNKLVCVRSQLPELKEFIDRHRLLIEKRLNRFDEIRDIIMAMAFERKFCL